MKAQSILFLFDILTTKSCCIRIYQTSLLFKIMKTVIYRIAKLTTFLILAHLKLSIWRIKRIIQWTIWIICKMNKIMTIKMSSINNQVISIIKFNRINSLWINIKRLHFNIKISLKACDFFKIICWNYAIFYLISCILMLIIKNHQIEWS